MSNRHRTSAIGQNSLIEAGFQTGNDSFRGAFYRLFLTIFYLDDGRLFVLRYGTFQKNLTS